MTAVPITTVCEEGGGAKKTDYNYIHFETRAILRFLDTGFEWFFPRGLARFLVLGGVSMDLNGP